MIDYTVISDQFHFTPVIPVDENDRWTVIFCLEIIHDLLLYEGVSKSFRTESTKTTTTTYTRWEAV